MTIFFALSGSTSLKAVRWTLMKSTTCDNFINILHTRFLSSFSQVTLGLVIFWRKNIGPKGKNKMLLKLTQGDNFINVLRAV
jgi:hypothetical protein